MELATIKINKSDLELLVDSGISFEFEAIKVEVKDDFFKDDKTHAKLKEASTKAYKELKIYEHNKRHGIL